MRRVVKYLGGKSHNALSSLSNGSAKSQTHPWGACAQPDAGAGETRAGPRPGLTTAGPGRRTARLLVCGNTL